MGWKDKKDPSVSVALKRFTGRTGLSLAEIGRIIGCDRSVISKVNSGYRPYAPILARLFMLTEDEGFAPKTEREKTVLKKEQASPPDSLTAYQGNQVEREAEPPSGSLASLRYETRSIEILKGFSGVFEETEIAYAVLLLEELTRIFKQLSKIEDRKKRSIAGRILAQRVDELYLAVWQSREAVPSAAAEHVAEMRQAFGERRKNLVAQKGKKTTER